MTASTDPRTVVLSLISHTNVGKTTLARTLLRDDIGEVADQPHVTDVSDAHTLIEAADGARLVLWDTPGFGNVAKLLERLKQADSPIGWLLSQVWDRYRDRPLWCSQQAVKNVQSEADVVLYLVDVNQNPNLVGYVDLEMQILDWIGKPVIVVLNQFGPPEGPEHETAHERRWHQALQRYSVVRATLALDAFSRCWTQEGRLFDALGPVVPADKRDPLGSLRAAWQSRSLQVFRQSIEVLAVQLSQNAREQEAIETVGWQERVRIAIRPILGGKIDEPTKKAIEALNERLNRSIVESTNRLIALHQLEGRASTEILEDLKESILVDEPVQELKTSVGAAVVTGALGGLSADLAAGGLTLGGGVIVGAILGGASALLLTRGYNRIWRKGRAEVRCSADLLVRLVQGALLRYLAVAHFGRGRGTWRENLAPKHWRSEIDRAVQESRPRIEQCVKRAAKNAPTHVEDLEVVLLDLAQLALVRLHPETTEAFADN